MEQQISRTLTAEFVTIWSNLDMAPRIPAKKKQVRFVMRNAARPKAGAVLELPPNPPPEMEFETVGDTKVCPICDDLDGQVYEADAPDLPPLPVHPNCRCVLVDNDTGEVVLDAEDVQLNSLFAPRMHEEDDCKWVTIRGNPVCIGGGGSGSKEKSIEKSPKGQIMLFKKIEIANKPTNSHKEQAKELVERFPGKITEEQAAEKLMQADKIRADHLAYGDRVVEDLKKALPEYEVTGRIKDADSMVGKGIRREKYADLETQHDVVGTRVIISQGGISAQEAAVQRLKDAGNFNFDDSKVENYVHNPKDGYRAIHVEATDNNGKFAEIQIKTPNQQHWSDYVHERYSPKDPDFRDRLKPHLATFDDYANKMSNYYYEKDLGKSPTKPKAPQIIIELMGKEMQD